MRPEPCGSGDHGWMNSSAKRNSLKSEYKGEVEQVALRARVHHEAKNWLILTDCSNAFNTMKRTAILAEAATCVPALTPFAAKCYDEISANGILSDGIGRKAEDRLLQRGATRGCHGAGVVLHAAPAGAEADTGGI